MINSSETTRLLDSFAGLGCFDCGSVGLINDPYKLWADMDASSPFGGTGRPCDRRLGAINFFFPIIATSFSNGVVKQGPPSLRVSAPPRATGHTCSVAAGGDGLLGYLFPQPPRALLMRAR